MAFWCYILRCSDGKYYTGHTDDLERRVAEHRQGGYCKFTSRRLPVELVWAADFPSRHEALDSEIRVGKWSRAKKEALIAQDWAKLSQLAKPPHERVSTSLDANGPDEGFKVPYSVRFERSRETDSSLSRDKL